MVAHPLPTADWGVDIAVTASQKGLMVPPGIGVITVGPRAWQAADRSDLPKYYVDDLTAERGDRQARIDNLDNRHDELMDEHLPDGYDEKSPQHRKALAHVNETWTPSKRLLAGEEGSLEEEHAAQARDVLARMKDEFGYCEHCAHEAIMLLARERYVD